VIEKTDMYIAASGLVAKYWSLLYTKEEYIATQMLGR
jgi:hypothetical protein